MTAENNTSAPQTPGYLFFTKQGECDFVVMEKGKAVVCIQVCWQIDDMNMKREISGLKTALDYFGLKDGVIVTHDQSDLFEVDGTNFRNKSR